MKLFKIEYKRTDEEYEENDCDSSVVYNISEFKSLNLIPLYDLLDNNRLWGYNLYLSIGNHIFYFLCVLKRNSNSVRNVKEIYDNILKFMYDNRNMLILRSNGYKEFNSY